MKIRSDAVVGGLLFLAPFILFFPVTLGAQIFSDGDFLLFFYPHIPKVIPVILAFRMRQGLR